MKSRETGKLGEAIARRHLRRQGFTILATNFYTRYGELDIVARDRESLVFVEVKCRQAGSGIEQAIGPKKIKCLQLSARSYLQRARLEHESFRFLLVYVLLQPGSKGPAAVHMVEDPF